MTLDQSLANLQAQADRLAGLFASTADAIEARTASAARAVSGYEYRPAVGEPVTGLAPDTDYAVRVNGGEPTTIRTDTPAGVVATEDGSLLNFEGENYVPQPTPEPAFVQDPNTGAQVPVAPAGNPFTTAAEPEPAKKKGRRTHEELAADAGVRLEDVKAWLGDKKVTKGAIEEYAALAAANAVGETPEQAAVQAPAPQAAVTTPPDGSHLPQAPAPAPEWTTGPDGQPAPVYAPPAPQQAAAPAPQYPQAAANPFGAPQGAAPDFGAGAVLAPQQPAAPVAQQPAPQFSPFETQPYPAQ